VSLGKFDVVIVGGGPAGLSSAYFLADAGFDILVIERGGDLGAKNVFGGRIYSHILDRYFDGWREEAPIERWVRSERICILCERDHISIEYRRDKTSSKYDSFNTFLSRFLKWLGDRVENKGASIITGMKVDELIIHDNKVEGVIVEGEKIHSDYVILAEGINPILSEKYGFRKKIDSKYLSLGIKEVIKLDAKKINERFNIDDTEGVAQFILGYPISDIIGGGFLYTMKEYVTLGMVININSIKYGEKQMMDIVEELRTHPYINKLVRDGTLVEYSSHIVSEGGLRTFLDKPYGNGYIIVGDAGGLLLNTGFTIRGVDFAMESGRLAADTIKYAHEKGETDEETLSIYSKKLKESYVYKALKKFKRIYKILENERIFTTYPESMCNVFNKIYTLEEEPYTMRENISENIIKRVGYITLLLDIIDMWRSM
jgi:electron transfer flavoprotein-quinone oxidoreductase